MEALKNGLVHFHEDNLVSDASWETGVLRFWARFDDQEEFLLNVGQSWRLDGEAQAFTAWVEDKQVVGASTEVRESRPKAES